MTSCLFLAVVSLMFGLGVECGRLPGFKSSSNHLDENQIKKMHTSFDYNGMVVNETIEANPENMVATYNVMAGDKVADIVDDYNSKIRLVRVGDVCVASPLNTNRSFSSGEEFAEWATDPNRQMMQESVHFAVDQRKQPIGKPDFLSYEAQRTCDGLPIYWADKENENSDNKRVKRDTYLVTITRVGD